jgi:electron transport complex protein RnfB
MAARLPLVDGIDALLPQTQCRRCGYDGCRPYAEAIATGAASINQCPPGGDATISALATLLNVSPLPLDPARGGPMPYAIARIDEATCIGCTLCIQACPVDAIVGASKLMHTVLADHCTGCELCLAPCPVDCIAMLPSSRAWTRQDAVGARERYTQREARLGKRANARGRPSEESIAGTATDVARERRQAAVASALARARARRATPRSDA